MPLARKLAAFTVVAVLAGGGALLFMRGRPTPPPAPPSNKGGGTPARFTPEDLRRAIIEGNLDPTGDRETIRLVLASMDAASRAMWIKEMAEMVGAMDPAVYAPLQRSMGFLALDSGQVDAGWAALGRLLSCKGCDQLAVDDAMRLLDQYTPTDDLRRKELTAGVCERANQILEASTKDTTMLPLVWSAMVHLKQDGRLQESVAMRQRYIERFTGVATPEAMLTARQNLAHDLVDLGRSGEARELFVSVADSLQGSSMSSERADYLVHAARAGDPASGIEYLEASLRNTSERQSAATTLVYLELVRLYNEAGNRTAALNAVERYWSQRTTLDAAGATEMTPEYRAMLCFRAGELAEAQHNQAQADAWYARAVEVGGTSTTANTVRRMLQSRARP